MAVQLFGYAAKYHLPISSLRICLMLWSGLKKALYVLFLVHLAQFPLTHLHLYSPSQHSSDAKKTV